MKFKWINSFLHRRRAKREAEESWHVWYAWYPVDVGDWDFRWLENVERTVHVRIDECEIRNYSIKSYRPLKEPKDES